MGQTVSGKWIVEGHDDDREKILCATFSARFGKPRMTEILRCLASRHLTPEEVVEDLSKEDRGRLHVHVDRSNGSLMTTGNPFYAARFVRD